MTAPIRSMPEMPSDLQALEDMLHLPDGVCQGPGSGARNREKTHCPQGHLYDEKNTRIRMRKGIPQRSCKKCQLENTARFHAERMKDPTYAQHHREIARKSAVKSREKQKQMMAEYARLKAKYEP